MRNRLPHILLVEDNQNDTELVKIALEEQVIPSELAIAADGEEALLYLQDLQRPLPDLVLLDLSLPKISGHEVLKRLREEPRTAELPVIIFTNSEQQKDLIESYNLGANAFITKGLDSQEFKAALKNLDVYWLLRTT